MMCSYRILPLLIFSFATYIANNQCWADNLPTKQEFYAKHHIENDTLMPSSFNETECLNAFTEIFNKRYDNNSKLVQDSVEYLTALLKQDMIPPEQYEGFYPPKNKIIFYNVAHKDNLLKLQLSPQDIIDLNLTVSDEMVRQWHMGMTIQQLEEKGFYTIANTAQLAAKVGNNIYLTGFYSDCGTTGCDIKMQVKENNKWINKNVHLLFDTCVADNNKTIFECDIVGGDNILWHYGADYAPLADLAHRYYDIWNDYIRQYLQRKEKY